MRSLVPSVLLLLALGCVDENAAPPPPMPLQAPGVAVPGATPVVAPPGAGQLPVPTPGYTSMTVDEVRPDFRGGWVLHLTDQRRSVRVPIYIGENEGRVIQRRLAGERFQRPLTHDLLDELVRTLGGRVVQVEIGELRSNTFIGTVVVWDGTATRRVDARSSDAVAVALGHGAPIYVAESVVTRTGVPRI